LVEKQNLVIMITPTILDEDTPQTGYEPKSEEKADELSEKGTDYFHIQKDDSGQMEEEGGSGILLPAPEANLNHEKQETHKKEEAASVEEIFQTLGKEDDKKTDKLKPLFG